MGRDFTPREHHAADRRYGFSKNRLVCIDAETGRKAVIYDPECEDALRWPNSSFLARPILEENKSSPVKMDMFEKVLAGIIELDDAGAPVKEAMETAFRQTVCRWYFGELDPDFYYSRTNDELMSRAVSDLGQDES